MVYTQFQDSYAIEATYGTTAIVDTNATTYLLGAISQESLHPNPRWNVQYRATAVNQYEVPAGELWKVNPTYSGMWGLRLQNGIPLWLVQGSSSTVGTDPYTHTITPSSVPSLTLQHERTGTDTDWAIQYTGVQCTRLQLINGHEAPVLIAIMDWVAKSAFDPGFTLTNAPALPTTSNSDAYTLTQFTRGIDIDDDDAIDTNIDGLVDFRLTIDVGLVPLFAHHWESGTYKGHEPLEYIEAGRRDYTLELSYSPEYDDLWDEMIATSNTKNLIFKWTRSTNDYIQIICRDVQVLAHESKTPEVGDILIEKIECAVRALDIEVKDSIAGGYYGE